MTSCLRSFIVAAITFAAVLPTYASDPDALLQLVDYIGVDYPVAVADGQVISPAEYAEMREFAARANALAAGLPAGTARDQALPATVELTAAIDARAPVEAVRAATRRVRSALLDGFPLDLAPAHRPDLVRAAKVYAASCASCHGATGDGAGPAAATLEPPPTAFTDGERARQRSLQGLYATISRGVDGTAMQGFDALSAEQRWGLAWYVGGLHLAATTPVAVLGGTLPDLRSYTTKSPLELVDSGVPQAVVAALRLDPTPLFVDAADPLVVARTKLAAALTAHAAGDRGGAYALALSAYLDGYELAEASLFTLAPERARATESKMLALRAALSDTNTSELRPRFEALDAELAALSALAAAPASLSPGMALGASFFILAREGLEALLLVGVIITVLVKTGQRQALPAIHGGWIAALLLGLVTWVVSSWLIAISGATRETTEGVAALIAAVVLFYVGFWMHDKLSAQRWQQFLQEQVQGALSGGSRATLALLSFIAVYREVFETVLFYQALWVQAPGGELRGAIIGGAMLAVLLLAALGLAIFWLGMRLPLRQFFVLSAGLMIALAVVFAGKGVAALQEAGRVALDPVAFPRIELLGVYPSLQSLGAQALLLAAAVALVLYNRRAEARSQARS
jgi:high-affinity iron transporter